MSASILVGLFAIFLLGRRFIRRRMAVDSEILRRCRGEPK